MRCLSTGPDGQRCVLEADHAGKHKAWDAIEAKVAAPLPIIEEELPIIVEPPPTTPDNLLGDLSKELNKIEAELQAEIHGLLQLGMTTAMRRAGARVVSRTRSKSAKAAAAAAPPDQRGTVILAGCDVKLAALGLEMTELLKGIFEEVVGAVLSALKKGHRRTLASIAENVSTQTGENVTVDVLVEQTERIAAEQRRRATEALLWRLNLLAEQRLTDPQGREIQGEDDIDDVVPFGVARDVLTIAGGVQPDPVSGRLARDAQGRTLDYKGEATTTPATLAGGPINVGVIERMVGAPLDDVRMVWRWNHSKRPFDPHQNLNGVVYTEEQATEKLKANEAEFPYVAEYHPGDHLGCRCTEEFTMELFDRGERLIDVALEEAGFGETPRVEEIT